MCAWLNNSGCKRNSVSISLRRRWHISHNRETSDRERFFFYIKFDSVEAQQWDRRDTAWYCVPTSSLFDSSTFTPQPNFTVQNPGCMMARCSLLNQWTRVDARPLTELTAHQYQRNTPMPACAWLIQLLLSLVCVPMEPRHVGSGARF